MEEFRIIDCKITLSAAAKLVDIIVKKSYLQKLALVNCNLSEKSVYELSKYTLKNQYLRELDLSWCKTSRATWTSFFTAVKDSKELRKLSLVGNMLIEQNDINGKETVENIVHFIKNNIHLLHVDFTDCFLKKEELKKIGSALRRSGSIVSIHFCLNPGLDADLVNYFRESLKCKLDLIPAKVTHPNQFST